MFRVSGTSPTRIPTSFALTGSKAAPARRCFLETRLTRLASERRTRKPSAITREHSSAWAASEKSYENQADLDPERKDKWGIPVLRFNYKFGDNEKKMCEDMVVAAQEMFELAGFEIVNVDRKVLTEGWSIHELGTARMGTDAKMSVLNQFQQSHDVKNLFVVDGSSHVSASCQNPTWTIMALAWRSCDYLASEFQKGNL